MEHPFTFSLFHLPPTHMLQAGDMVVNEKRPQQSFPDWVRRQKHNYPRKNYKGRNYDWYSERKMRGYIINIRLVVKIWFLLWKGLISLKEMTFKHTPESWGRIGQVKYVGSYKIAISRYERPSEEKNLAHSRNWKRSMCIGYSQARGGIKQGENRKSLPKQGPFWNNLVMEWILEFLYFRFQHPTLFYFSGHFPLITLLSVTPLAIF